MDVTVQASLFDRYRCVTSKLGSMLLTCFALAALTTATSNAQESGIHESGIQESGLQAPDSATNTADREVPYNVFVKQNDGFARCGPSEKLYRTDSLRLGQQLEVYLETKDGWLGIRPVNSSFCWLPADQVELTDDGTIGMIIEDQVTCWIGTNLGQAKRYRWQVQLDAGEEVAILGSNEQQADDSKEQRTWLRIVPPPGEFRWVHRDQIVPTAEALAKILTNPNAASPDAAIMQVNNETEVAQPIKPNQSPAPSTAETGNLSKLDPKSILNASPIDSGQAVLSPLPPLQNTPADVTVPHSTFEGPVKFHLGKSNDQFPDQGAVIGSGLKDAWRSLNPIAGNSSQQPTLAVTDGQSVLEPNDTMAPATQAIAPATAQSELGKPASTLDQVSKIVANFVGTPRLVEMNQADPLAENATTLSDQRWAVGNVTRNTTPNGTSGSTSRLAMPVIPQKAIRAIPVTDITRVQDALVNANADTLDTILAKLVAESASADETDLVVKYTEQLLRSGNIVDTTRLRDTYRRAAGYRDLAKQRDGATQITTTMTGHTKPPLVGGIRMASNVAPGMVNQASASNDTNALPANQLKILPTSGNLSTLPPALATPSTGPETHSASGFLVQVYSARQNSPPYALTDDAGLTVAYVTPYPGVNLRSHLNNRVTISGLQKFVQGMNTPHLLADKVTRN